MVKQADNRKEGLLGRWLRLKRESTASNEGDGLIADCGVTDTAPAGAVSESAPARAASESAPVRAASESAPVRAVAESTPPGVRPDSDCAKTAAEAPDLPSIDELAPDSDFAAFMDPRVDDDVRRAALKTLFRDPDFNVTDGLDVYAEDYTKLEKLTPAMVAALRFAKRTLFGKADETEVEHAQANDGPSELESNKADYQQVEIAQVEPQQLASETLHTESDKN
ncbi:MAG: DUF3306 domain-containing protein [Betaproteobacteria bacterium]|nr:MAG: DUF3306 domain-containing protein [Betaproteobacteria bacterium]